MSGPHPGVVLVERYRLLDVIGRGGMGEVWRATDESLNRYVAIKTLAVGRTRTRAMSERFRHEALAVAQLNQRRVAAVYDYLEVDGHSYIVMELLDGESLSEALNRTRILPAEEAAEIVTQAAEGLQAAHDAGIAHRDIKPANIMLTAHGVKLLDFGLAATAWNAGLTSTGTFVGTLSYISPERTAGDPGSPTGDIYGLGVVLYEALAGHPPFQADNPLALIHAQAAGEPAPLPVGTPAALATACLRALAKDPADRFPTAAAFAAAIRGQTARPSTDTALLASHVQPEPALLTSHVRPEPATRRHATGEVAAPPPRRASRPVNRRAALLGGLAVALLAAVLVFWPDNGSPARTEAGPEAEVPAQQAGPQRSAVANAINTLLEDIADATETGDILRDTAKDLAKSVKNLRQRLAAGDPTDVARRLDDLNDQVTERTGEGKIEAGAAATLRADIDALATAAGISR